MSNVKSITVFLICICQSVLAQENRVVQERKEAYLTFEAFSAFIYQSPRFTFGYVQPIHRRWLVGIDLGYSNKGLVPNYFDQRLIIGNKYEIFEIRPQVYFKLKPSSKFRPYLSAEFFYVNHKDHFVNETEYQKNRRYIQVPEQENISGPRSISYDSADYLRHKTGVNVNIGLFLTLFDKVGINIGAGIGIRNRDLQYRNVINPTFFSPPENEAFVESPLTYEIGNHLGANVSLNFKLFYKFNQN